MLLADNNLLLKQFYSKYVSHNPEQMFEPYFYSNHNRITDKRIHRLFVTQNYTKSRLMVSLGFSSMLAIEVVTPVV